MIQSLYIIQLISITINFLYLNISFGKKSIPIYDVNAIVDNSLIPSLDNDIIYLTTPTSQKKLLLFIAGLYNQTYNSYMEKTYQDMIQNEEIREKYLFMIYENRTLTNFDVAIPISRYLEKIIEKYNLDEIVVLGFSAGGIVASHVMSHIKHIQIEKKLVAYDCPLDIYSMLNIQFNSFSKLDVYFYMIVRMFHENNFCGILADTLKHCIWKTGNEPVVFELTQKIHNISREEMIRISHLNIDQDENTDIYFINCIRDPVFESNIRDKIIDMIREKCVRFPKIYEKPWIGHCSDMAFSKTYLLQLIDIIGVKKG